MTILNVLSDNLKMLCHDVNEISEEAVKQAISEIEKDEENYKDVIASLDLSDTLKGFLVDAVKHSEWELKAVSAERNLEAWEQVL